MKKLLADTLLLPRAHRLGWGFTALLCWAGLLVSLPGYYLWFVQEPIRHHFTGLQMTFSVASGLASLFCAVTSLVLGVFLFLRKPGDRGALYVSFLLLLFGFLMGGPLEMVEYLFTGQTLAVSARVQAIFFTLPTFLLFLTFPNGVIVPARFRWLLLFVLPVIPLVSFLRQDEVNSISTLRSKLIYAYLTVLLICAVAAQVYRYFWVSTPAERQQTKIVLFGIGIQAFFLAISGAIYFQLPQETLGSIPDNTPLSLVWWAGIAVLPISFTLAIVRSHLWDIDVVIRRTLVYGFLTAILALVYFAGVVLMQGVFRVIAGHESPLAVILSTLASAALFTPLRRYLQAAIDRRFFRAKYDSEQALARFQHNLRGQVRLEQVESELTGIVMATVQPEWVSLAIRNPPKEG
jgi:hypothetical protein